MSWFGKKNKNEKKDDSNSKTSNTSFTRKTEFHSTITTTSIFEKEFGSSNTTERKTFFSSNPTLPIENSIFDRQLSLPPTSIRRNTHSTDAIPYKPTNNTYTPVYNRPSFGSSAPKTTSNLSSYNKPASSTTYTSIYPKPAYTSQPYKPTQPYKPPQPYTPAQPYKPPQYAPPKPPQSLPPDSVIEKPLKIVVKKSTKFFDQNNKVPTYPTHGKKRGSCIIINNVEFPGDTKSQRKGANVDEKNLTALFKGLGFVVESYKNLTAMQMEKKLKTYSEKASLKSVDINIVVMMSHGHGSRDGGTVICGTDNKAIATADVIELFDNDNCRYLENKPKIFIFQCCRGGADQKVETDAIPFIPKKKLNDMLLAYSTIPGFVSHRSPELGTWYIEALCKIFMEHACEIDVENMLKMVEEKMTILNNNSGYTQTSSYENRGFKTCYLHPV